MSWKYVTCFHLFTSSYGQLVFVGVKHGPSGLEIPISLIANAMRNGERLQHIPYIIAWLSIFSCDQAAIWLVQSVRRTSVWLWIFSRAASRAIRIWRSVARLNFVVDIYSIISRSFNNHVGYKILRSHSPEEFYIALAIGLLLKLNTASVRPSVTPFSPCSHHRIIMKFSGVITNDKSDIHAKGQGQRSKPQRSRSQRSTPNLTVSGL